MMAAIVIAAAIAWSSVPLRNAVAVGGSVYFATSLPFLIVPGVVVGSLSLAMRSLATRRRQEAQAQEDLAAMCDLAVIGLAGGMGINAALQTAMRHVGPALASEVGAVIRQAQVVGSASAFMNADGIGERLYRVVGMAVATGQPLSDSVARLADDINAEQATQRLEALRRLPVAMLFPLTLLILPGFLLLTIAPAVLDAFSRLDF